MKGDKGVDNKNRRKRMTLSRRGSLTGWAFLAPGAILILFMSFIPIFRALIISFQTGVGAGNKFNGIGNYVRMFQEDVYKRQSLLHSAKRMLRRTDTALMRWGFLHYTAGLTHFRERIMQLQ